MSEEQQYKLFNCNGEYIHLLVTEVSAIEDLRYKELRTDANKKVAFLRGEHCRNSSNVMNQLQAALQFPYYFGGNHAALKDCMTDMSWLDFKSMLIVVTEAQEFLSEDGEASKKLMLDYLYQICNHWERKIDEPYRRPFKLLFQVSQDHFHGFQEFLHSINFQ